MFELAYRFCRHRRRATFMMILVIEAATLLFRFGLGLKSTEHTASTVGRLTMGIRIHHGYVGLILLAMMFFSRFRQNRNADVMFVVGMSLFLSDVLHHGLLYLITGSADLDLVYPGSST